MKTSTLVALTFIGPTVSAQAPTSQWLQEHFGVNLVTPTRSRGPVNENTYSLPSYVMDPWNDLDGRVCIDTAYNYIGGASNNTSFITTDIHSSKMYTDAYWLTNRLPANTWIRVAANVWENYPAPDGVCNDFGFMEAILKDMVVGPPTGPQVFTRPHSGALNVMWNLTPGLFPDVGGWGAFDPSPIGLRNTWRPHTGTYLKLKNNVGQFILYANILGLAFAGNDLTFNWTQKQSFQLGNEPAVGHPGGSDTGEIGSWVGLGSVMEGTMIGHSWNHPSNPSWGTNPRVLPAFSMHGDSGEFLYMGLPSNRWNNTGASTPGVNEVATYYDEVVASPNTWANQCSRRALHFRSPKIQKIGAVDSRGISMLLNHDQDLEFENPSQYADRWVKELKRQVNMVSRLNMPGSVGSVVDVTECYVATGSFGYKRLGVGGAPHTFGTNTLRTIREDSRKKQFQQPGNLHKQIPAPRIDYLVAIRDKLYATSIPNLGRIYWWGTYDPDPRHQTGLFPSQSGMLKYTNPDFANNLYLDGGNVSVTTYDPDQDFRLTREEIRALFPNMAT